MVKGLLCRKKRKAISFVEVMAASLILTTAFAGVVSTFTMARGDVGRSHDRMMAVSRAMDQLGELQNAIRWDIWNTGDLSTGGHGAVPIEWVVSDDVSFDLDGDGIMEFREIQITVTY